MMFPNIQDFHLHGHFFPYHSLSGFVAVCKALRIATSVNMVLAGGDFHLGSWASNDPAVVAALQPFET